jgi:hypothetical protein
MIKKNALLYTLILISLFSCEKKEKELPVSGEITVNTELTLSTSYYANGFSFEKNEFVKVFTPNQDADLVPVSIGQANGQVGMKFGLTTANIYGFYLNGQFSDLASAETYFNSYRVAMAPAFISLTDSVKPFQVYTMKTSRQNWVKFLVQDVRPVEDSRDIVIYYEADLKYVIQRDGTTDFPE